MTRPLKSPGRGLHVFGHSALSSELDGGHVRVLVCDAFDSLSKEVARNAGSGTLVRLSLSMARFKGVELLIFYYLLVPGVLNMVLADGHVQNCLRFRFFALQFSANQMGRGIR